MSLRRTRVARALCRALTLAAFCMVGGCSSYSATQALEPGFAGPLVIDHGGTYTGRWQSTNPSIPVVRINTSEPVVLRDSVLRGAGNLIMVYPGYRGANLTVTNVSGTALNANVAGKPRGMFLYVEAGGNIQVDHCTMRGVSSGVVLAPGAYFILNVVANAAYDMDDRESDGRGGMSAKRSSMGHFVLFDGVVATRGGEIAWNQVINRPGQSSTEDIVNLYNSQGASAEKPIRIHDNYLQGAVSAIGKNYTGGGITTDGEGKAGVEQTAFLAIDKNQIVETENNGIFAASGHDIAIENNRVVSSGKDASGAWLASPLYGGYGYTVANFYHGKNFGNIRMEHNFSAMVRLNKDGTPIRADFGEGVVAASNGTFQPVDDARAVTAAMEQAEYQAWLKKLAAAHVSVGAAASLQ